MKFKQIITLILLFPFSLMAQDSFQITGKLSKITGDKSAILSYKNTAGKDARDTVVIKNGNFAFNGETAYGNKAYISVVSTKKDTSKFAQQLIIKSFT